MSRHEEIASGLERVRTRIRTACETAGRDPEDVTLVVVTKFFPVEDVRVLADLGVRHVGENRHPEGARKAEACAHLDLVWHFIGGLQSNKATAVARYADVVESVDRVKLIPALERGALEREAPLRVLLQVSLDPPGRAGRSGADPADLPDLAARVTASDRLVLGGLMAVAPLDEDPDRAFARLAGLRDGFVTTYPAATDLSAGMSGDLEQAIRHGATHVRVGSAVLGPRPPIL